MKHSKIFISLTLALTLTAGLFYAAPSANAKSDYQKSAKQENREREKRSEKRDKERRENFNKSQKEKK